MEIVLLLCEREDSINTDLPDDIRRSYMSLLNEAVIHQAAPEAVREDARRFIEFQTGKA